MLLLVLGIVLSLPFVQTKIAQYFTQSINKDFGTNITIDEVSISIFGGVKLKKVLILDHHKDTLIYVNRIKTNLIGGKKLLDGDLIFGDIELDGFLFNLKTYKNEKETNIDVFINAFGTGKPNGKHFLLTAKNAKITNGHFILTDENREIPKDVDFTRLNASISDFKLYGPNVNTIINKLSFLDHRGIFVVNLSSKFSYTKKRIQLEDLDLLTKESKIKGTVYLNYKIEDFLDFNNKVQFDAKINSSSIASNDIRCFYKELGRNQHFDVKATLKGTLNDLNLSNLKLVDSKKSQIIGFINFKNLFPKKEQQFYMNGKFKKLSLTYDDLVTLLPNVLGKKLPNNLKKLGAFTIIGNTQVTSSYINANFSMSTEIGNVQSHLAMKNIDFIDNASYTGNVVLGNFDIGTFLDRTDVGKVSMNIDVDGKGFSEKYLNLSIKGDISKIDYKNYSYSNVAINGNFNREQYKGKVSVNDPNLNMT
ncbi:MAG: translocation/assembly module TamB, partial [Flavobacterium sp.]|nr:translocation/assembly module TamB [Flavobacterium sp.]